MRALFLLPAILCVQLPLTASEETGAFETRVRPVLVNQCGACHGARQSMAGLRLDSRDAMLKGGQSGSAIMPGNSAGSLLTAAIRHTHPTLRMPPTGRLPEAQIEAIVQWIDSGAIWPETSSAKADQSHWAFQPLAPTQPGASIDSLVREGLAGQKLRPNPRAGARTLIRRLSFDLAGLPPNPEDVDRFVADPSPKATAELVDRLLASPHFGERWGRHWLDVARFGEDDYTGTEPKPYDNAWRYRDWVIQAFNDDLPYDLFVKAQIAGDLLPEPNGRYLGGLGLFGFGPWYYGISQPPQARADERHDRVDMITRGFLGLTVACARCHDHKYDPVSIEDYYALAGIFASSQYEEYPLAPPDEVSRYKDHQGELKIARQEWKQFEETQSSSLAQVLAHRIEDSVLAAARIPKETEISGSEPPVAVIQAAEAAGLDAEALFRWTKYLRKSEWEHPLATPLVDELASGSEEAIREAAARFQDLAVAIAREKAELDTANRELVIRAKTPGEQRRKTILPFGYDSEEDFNPGADVPTRSLPRDRFLLWSELFEPPKGLLVFRGDSLLQFLSGEWKRFAGKLRARVEELERSGPAPYPFLQGLAEHESPIDLGLHIRGNPFELGDPVPRGFLAVLDGGKRRTFPSGSGRLDLAQAIVEQPLAARVIVNRVWLHLFGEALVRTPGNFGATGDRPSNPMLLDYLAVRLRQQNWSLKSLIREIVLSDTYQASADETPQALATDPGNRLFGRQNRRRLEAEAIRDAILAVSGCLDPAVGGPSQPLGPDNLRRTVYARIGRFRQEETLSLFDFPSATVTSEKRSVTNVPLQRLFFLNSDFVLQRAQALAERLHVSAPGDEGRIRAAYRLLFGRAPTSDEQKLGLIFLAAGGSEAWRDYAQVLISSNEFLFVE